MNGGIMEAYVLCSNIQSKVLWRNHERNESNCPFWWLQKMLRIL